MKFTILVGYDPAYYPTPYLMVTGLCGSRCEYTTMTPILYPYAAILTVSVRYGLFLNRVLQLIHIRT